MSGNNERIREIVQHVNKVMEIIDLYKENRPGSIAIQKLEEAVFWCEAMINHCEIKQTFIPKDDIETIDITAMTSIDTE